MPACLRNLVPLTPVRTSGVSIQDKQGGMHDTGGLPASPASSSRSVPLEEHPQCYEDQEDGECTAQHRIGHLDGPLCPEVAANQHAQAQDRSPKDVHMAAAVVADGPKEPDGIDQCGKRCPLSLMLRHSSQKYECWHHQCPTADSEEAGQDSDADAEHGEDQDAANQFTLQCKTLPAG